MTDWKSAGNTAVITGGASGIGLEFARRYASAGMNVAIADRNSEALDAARDELIAIAGNDERIMAQLCDVSESDQIESLCDAVYDKFGAVHCLMNNAGMGRPTGAPWESMDELQQMMSINMGGVILGCHCFIPRMLEGKEPGVVINTGSKQGITRPPGNYGYNLSKVGVLAYTESVAHAFATMEGCPLTAHLLVPGFVYTPMISSFLPEKPPSAWTAEQTVDFALPAIERGDFYILCPDGDATREIDEKRIQWNADDIIENRPALSRWHPDYAEAFERFMAAGSD
ncbi:SDR family NAD(P)-dependent oxidoreductase [Parasphingopyxis sp. CP4]|uniref:SDR family NAD(P)-dependent oxidoreductase n=1 Tax=Parasphingopyxis sp. CP4 TaxID=2724527 RepID=UPI0015A14AAA|nr:SDR family NAD(P)-dependent oxidoreductase [Parasphingopyxis sp. CP4]QLC22281.1 SDR family NAD(P)-dependent oxidoreductase [Parasphingopyxis sp. CP4]